MLDSVKKLAIGTAQFGMDYGIANRNGQVQGDEIAMILDLALQNGIDTLDTAKAYGKSEEAIGNYLKKRPGNSCNIMTKLSESDISVADQIKDSTEKLTVHPSVVLAHSAKLFLDEEFQSELEGAKKDQLIRKTGVSLYGEDEINQVLESAFEPNVIQLPMNILDTKLYHCGILGQLEERGIEIHARSVFLQGVFYLPEPELNNHFPDAVPYIEKLKAIAKKAVITLAELSLLWLVSLAEVSKVVIGMDSTSQLKDHLKILEKKVDADVFEEALSVHYGNENILNPSLWK